MPEKLDSRTEKFRKEYLGKHFFTTDGKVEFYISEANSYGDVTITFIPSGLTKHTKVGNIKMGISNPFAVKGHPELTKPFVFSNPQAEYEGLRFKTNEGTWIQIIKYDGYNNVHYKFLDEFGYCGVTTLQNVKKGEIRNPYARNAMGGYLGDNGPYSGIEFDWLRNTWYQMLTRASGKRHEYAEHTNVYLNVTAYDDVAIYPTWYNYTLFANWYMDCVSKINFNKEMEFQVDKDLLYPYYSQFSRGRKCYSPFTCTLLPKSINVAIANTSSFQSMDNMKRNIENAYMNGYIDQDIYYVFRRFYFKDSAYANYVTIRINDMKMNLCGF